MVWNKQYPKYQYNQRMKWNWGFSSYKDFAYEVALYMVIKSDVKEPGGGTSG